jgi:hypothetical protein
MVVATQHRNGATQQRSPQQLKGAALCCAANGRGLSRLWLNRPYSVQGCRAVHQGTLPWYTCAGGWKQRQLVYVRLLRAEEDPARTVVQSHIDRACSAVQSSAAQRSAVAAVQWPIARKVKSVCFASGAAARCRSLFAIDGIDCRSASAARAARAASAVQFSLLSVHVQCL